MDTPQTKLLIIDDDRELADLLTDYLSAEGFAVDVAADGHAGLERALGAPPALIVLDVMLPGLSGFEVLRRLRRSLQTPVLMLTARGEDIDRIVGLELGADDYLAKPFNPRELVARIRAVLRRTEAAHAGAAAASAGAPADAPKTTSTADTGLLVVGDVQLHPASLTVRRGGEVVALTSAEFGLLEALLEAAGKVVNREDLTERVLGRRLSPFDRSIDVHMSNLRKKLGKDKDGQDRIKTVRGVGYLYARDGGPA